MRNIIPALMELILKAEATENKETELQIVRGTMSIMKQGDGIEWGRCDVGVQLRKMKCEQTERQRHSCVIWA